MKMFNIKKALYTICGVAACTLAFQACQLEPYELPAEEIYLRNFIKKYGLIDPNQDFNAAQESKVTVNLGSRTANEVNVLVKLGKQYYRIAFYADVTGEVTIPLDVPEGVDTLYVLVDGDVYSTTLGGSVDATSKKHKAASRDDEPAGLESGYLEMGWLLVAEDLGATDDFDFNDIIVRIQSVTVNNSALKLALDVAPEQCQVIEDDEHLVLTAAPTRATEAEKEATKILRITAMCAGGTLPLYLHFNNGTNDYVLQPHATNIYNLTGSAVAGVTTVNPYETPESEPDNVQTTYEWHNWFGVSTYTTMINTGHTSATGQTCTVIVPTDFSMANYSNAFSNYDGVNGPTHSSTADWAYSTSLSDRNIQGFYITVRGVTKHENQTLAAPAKGAAPQMFLIPDAGNDGRWKWPTERTSITDVYEDFTKWVNNTTSVDWYLKAPKTTNYITRTDN